MDKRKTQRILGILVIIALIIIIFPLFFNNDEAPSKMGYIQAPPFPESQQTAPEAEIASSAPNGSTSGDTADPENASVPVDLPSNNVQRADINDRHTTEDNDDILSSIDTDKTPPNQNALAPNKTKEKQTTSKNSAKNTKKSITLTDHASKELIKFTTSAWAVQIGSFKNKDNARQLTDKLRRAGYHAFSKEINSSQGITTRVYIGPEFKHANARKISEKLSHEMNIQAVIISYKPVAL